MWERMTEGAKHVVSAARGEAEKIHAEYVDTEHILLGLVKEDEGIAAKALLDTGLDLARMQVEILRLVGDSGANAKHYLLTDAQGIPLCFTVTGANAHGVTQLLHACAQSSPRP